MAMLFMNIGLRRAWRHRMSRWLASLNATRSQIDSLTAAVNALALDPELPPAPARIPPSITETVALASD